MPTTCPSHDELHAYSVGLLSDEASDAIAAHVASCMECRSSLSTFDGVEDTLLKQLRRPAVADPFLEESQCRVAVARACNVPDAPDAGRDKRSLSGKTLGEYQLIGELGQGGMGTVYKALHMKLDRVVALKVLSRGRAADGPAISRFEREMRAVGKISHPNVVQAYDAREIDGMPVLIMEFIDGLDMAQIVRRSGPLTVADACEVVRRTALGLQQAHEYGLVHRDIKPSNIMLTRAGEVKLLDLGLARFYAESAEGEEMTGTGQAMGTADYMAPEQASDCRTVDIRADLYSLGCTLYKLLAGRAPFSGPQYVSALDKMNAHVREPVPPIRQFAPQVPEELAALIDRLLAKDPADRPATPADVCAALEPFCAGANLAALVAWAAAEGSLSAREREGQVGTPSPAPVRRRRWPILRTLLIGLAFLGSLAAAFAAGILITIKKDGQTYQLEVPANSRTTVDEKGNALVTISGELSRSGTANATTQATTPSEPSKAELHASTALSTSDQKAIQGNWKVVRFEAGRKAAVHWSVYGHDLNLKNAEFWTFRDGVAGIAQKGNDMVLVGYSLDLRQIPKKISMCPLSGTADTLEIYGIYKLQDDELTMAVRVGGPRPEKFESPSDSDVAILILRRDKTGAGHIATPPGPGHSAPGLSPPSAFGPPPPLSGPTARPAEPRSIVIPTPSLLDIPRTPAAPAAGPPADIRPTPMFPMSSLPAQPVSAEAELRRLQGQWKVVRVEKGKRADSAWAVICSRGSALDPATTARFEFRPSPEDSLIVKRRSPAPKPDPFTTPGMYPPWYAQSFDYRLDPTASPKRIDLVAEAAGASGVRESTALGIYEIQGEQLKIHLVRRVLALQEQAQRPKDFAIDPESGDVLFVLERYPAEEEKKIQGSWSVVTETVDGAALPETQRPGPRWLFNEDYFRVNSMPDPNSGIYMPFVLEADREPKRITLLNSFLAGGNTITGIYRLGGDRLHIAYRQDGSLPQDFESRPGSNVTVFELRKLSPAEAAQPPKSEGKGESAKPSDSMISPASPVADPSAFAMGMPGFGVPDDKRIQGTWQVVNSSFRLLRKMQPFAELPDQEIFKSSQVVITADTFKILGQHVTTLAFRYKLNPAPKKNKMIDLQIAGSWGLVSYGIYELDGNGSQLRICASDLRSLIDELPTPDDKALRPAALWSPLGSKLELLVLRRVSDAAVSEDEKSIRGAWKVEESSDEWPDLGISRNAVLKFSRDEWMLPATWGEPDDFRLAYALNPATKPRRLDLATLSAPDMEPIHGAYELKGDRLTIAWKAAMPTPHQSHQAYPAPPREVAASDATKVVVLKRVAETAKQATKSEGNGESKGLPEVNVVHPVVRQVTPHEDLTGRLEAAQTAEVRSRVTGHLAKVLFKPGATVKQGDLLFELDPAPFQTELNKCQADLRLAQLRVKRTAAALKDAQKPSPGERQRLEAEQAEAEAAVTAAQEGVHVAQLNLESTRLTAPISGKIGRPLVSAGSLVANTTVLATIDPVDPIGVAFPVPQKTVLSLRRSATDRNQESPTPVFVRLGEETGFTYEGKVESADTHIDPATGTAVWRAKLPNPDGLLMPGMAVGVRLVTGAPYQAILVPEIAIGGEAGQQFVYVVTEKNIVQRRTVNAGDRDEGLRVVKEGLTADDRVILEVLPEKRGSVISGPMPVWQEGMTVKPRKTSFTAPQPSSEVKPSTSGSPSK